MNEDKATLAVIAANIGVNSDSLRIASLIPGRPAVFSEDGACACAVGSKYWMQARAQAKAQKSIGKMTGRGQKGGALALLIVAIVVFSVLAMRYEKVCTDEEKANGSAGFAQCMSMK